MVNSISTRQRIDHNDFRVIVPNLTLMVSFKSQKLLESREIVKHDQNVKSGITINTNAIRGSPTLKTFPPYTRTNKWKRLFRSSFLQKLQRSNIVTEHRYFQKCPVM